MTRTIVIEPLTRIEGHAKVSILLEEDLSVREARFQVNLFRGFERFCEGRPYYEMPSITSRTCGICSVSHLLASAKACDELVSVTIPRTAEMLRRLMHVGQIIQSHALSFFHLSSPDLLLGMDSDPATRNIFGLMESHPEVARNGIRLRRFGQEIIERLAGKRIHPSDWIVPGGVRWPLTREKADQILSELPDVLRITTDTISMFKDMLEPLEEWVRSLGNFPSNYMALVNEEGGLEHYDGEMRLIGPKGEMVADHLDPQKYYEFLGEAVEPWSYMKFPYYRPLGYPEGTYRVGPLARLNIVSHCGTPLADEELREFKKLGENGIVQSSFLYHYARLVEILFCLEHAQDLLEVDEICAERVWARASLNREEGVGVAEAPRGTLIHHYKVDEQGMTKWVNLMIATQHSNAAYNKAVTQVAKKYVRGERISEGLLNRVEAVVRAFDPCLSCASHSFGSKGLDTRLYDFKGNLLDRVVR